MAESFYTHMEKKRVSETNQEILEMLQHNQPPSKAENDELAQSQHLATVSTLTLATPEPRKTSANKPIGEKENSDEFHSNSLASITERSESETGHVSEKVIIEDLTETETICTSKKSLKVKRLSENFNSRQIVTDTEQVKNVKIAHKSSHLQIAQTSKKIKKQERVTISPRSKPSEQTIQKFSLKVNRSINPFVRLRKLHHEMKPVADENGCFLSKNYRSNYLKITKEQIDSIRNELHDFCTTGSHELKNYSDNSLSFKNLSLLKELLDKHFGKNHSVESGSEFKGLSSSVLQNSGQKPILRSFFELNQASSLTDSDIRYLSHLHQFIQKNNGQLNYLKFLQSYWTTNKQKIAELMTKVDTKHSQVEAHREKLKVGRLQLPKYIKFLKFTSVIKNFKGVLGNYLKVKEEMKTYFSYLENKKSNMSSISGKSLNKVLTKDNAKSRELLAARESMLDDVEINKHGKLVETSESRNKRKELPHNQPSSTKRNMKKKDGILRLEEIHTVDVCPVSKSQTVDLTKGVSIVSQDMKPENIIVINSDSQPSSKSKKLQKQKSQRSKIKHPTLTEGNDLLDLIDPDCCICFSYETSPTHPVIYCSKCNQGGHIKCLNLREIPSEDYYCLSCKHKGPQPPPVCYICRRSNFMLLETSGEKPICYHLFCIFSTKSWEDIFNRHKTLRTKDKNRFKCYYCDKTTKSESKIAKCYLCKKKSFHSICGFFNGLYIAFQSNGDLKLEDFEQKYYKYSVDIYCEECTVSRFGIMASYLKLDNVQELIFMNAYMRKILSWPLMFFEYPTYEKYRAARIKNPKLWSEINWEI